MTTLRFALLLALVAALAACGGHARRAAPQPRLPHTLAVRLAALSDDVARKLDAGDDCGALAAARNLQQQTIVAINARRVPPALQEPLQGAANSLAVRIRCTPPAPAPQKEHKHKGRGKGHEKHGKEGD